MLDPHFCVPDDLGDVLAEDMRALPAPQLRPHVAIPPTGAEPEIEHPAFCPADKLGLTDPCVTPIKRLYPQ